MLTSALLIPLSAVLLGILYSFNQESKVSFFEICAQGFKRLAPFLVLALLSALIIALGLCFLIIPRVFLAMRYGLPIAVSFFENKKGFEALARSKVLAEKHYFFLLKSYAVCVGAVFVAFLFISFFARLISLFILNAIILTYGAMFISCIYYLIYSQLILSEKYKVAATSLHAQEEIEVLERQHDE